MSPSTDERREVAERLRDIESIYGEQRYPFPEIDFVLALAKTTGTPLDSTLRDLALRLADLIEPKEIDEDTSDGYHTFRQLYYQRMILFSVLVAEHKELSWKTRCHEDGKPCFGGGWFLVTIDTPAGPYGYHYEDNYWDLFDCEELPKAKHWDGYDEKDVWRLAFL